MKREASSLASALLFACDSFTGDRGMEPGDDDDARSAPGVPTRVLPVEDLAMLVDAYAGRVPGPPRMPSGIELLGFEGGDEDDEDDEDDYVALSPTSEIRPVFRGGQLDAALLAAVLLGRRLRVAD
jgi:hypothetical protein